MAALAEETVVALEVPVAGPPPLPAVSVGFRNPESVRAALLSVAITFLPSSLAAQFSPVLFFGGLFVNGLLGVLLFLRKSGRSITTIEGARQGWISGLFFFGITFVLSTASLLVSGKGGISNIMREQAKLQGTLTPDVAKILDEPAFLAAVIFIASVVLFVLFTSLASVGGMLGARLFRNGNANPSEEPGSKLG